MSGGIAIGLCSRTPHVPTTAMMPARQTVPIKVQTRRSARQSLSENAAITAPQPQTVTRARIGLIWSAVKAPSMLGKPQGAQLLSRHKGTGCLYLCPASVPTVSPVPIWPDSISILRPGLTGLLRTGGNSETGYPVLTVTPICCPAPRAFPLGASSRQIARRSAADNFPERLSAFS
ncbi:MAG: hypothetical protein JWM36_4226 [Hyphomicrobiales bacterium]|nr:hypothetical protein [Hyphomicrobiales bacterium]